MKRNWNHKLVALRNFRLHVRDTLVTMSWGNNTVPVLIMLLITSCITSVNSFPRTFEMFVQRFWQLIINFMTWKTISWGNIILYLGSISGPQFFTISLLELLLNTFKESFLMSSFLLLSQQFNPCEFFKEKWKMHCKGCLRQKFQISKFSRKPRRNANTPEVYWPT